MLDADEIAQKAIQLYKAGARFFSFVTSGYMITEDDVETICKAARIIKKETDLTLCDARFRCWMGGDVARRIPF